MPRYFCSFFFQICFYGENILQCERKRERDRGKKEAERGKRVKSVQKCRDIHIERKRDTVIDSEEEIKRETRKQGNREREVERERDIETD